MTTAALRPDGVIWPDLPTFRTLAATSRVIPVARKVVADGHSALSIYSALTAQRPGSFLLESAEHGRSWSRWSFVGVRSQAMLTDDGSLPQWYGKVPTGLDAHGNALEALRAALVELQSPHVAGLPPLTGGLVGHMSYDSVRLLENIGDSCNDELKVPLIGFLLATDLAAVDHHEGTVTLIANAVNFNNTDAGVDEAWRDAVTRLDAMTQDLAASTIPTISLITHAAEVPEDPEDFEFLHKVDIAKEHIRAGDAFQIVLSQRFRRNTTANAFDIYRALRMSNPSPYMFLMRIPVPESATADGNFTETAFDIVGSSPEALVRVANGEAMVHPIAGTRPRGATAEEDAELATGLLADEKERAEHLMLVDLGRNDLGRVCTSGSVVVSDFMSVERYSHVMHLVSTVTGQVSPELTGCDVLYATFPAGTLSGAPKPRAMQIIEELESVRRGVYGGCVGYLDFAGNVDMAIAIRTAVLKDGIAYVQAGAGIVADSVPASESAECRHKAAAVLRAITVAESLRDAT